MVAVHLCGQEKAPAVAAASFVCNFTEVLSGVIHILLNIAKITNARTTVISILAGTKSVLASKGTSLRRESPTL